MLLTEYNEAEIKELFREEGRREGRREGTITVLINLVRKGRISKEVAAEEANMTINEFSALMMKA